MVVILVVSLWLNYGYLRAKREKMGRFGVFAGVLAVFSIAKNLSDFFQKGRWD